MSSESASIRVQGLSKRFEMYAQPVDRLKQMVLPRMRRWAHRRERAYFREFWALRDVNFTVQRGETVGIVGRNGAGKSTLLQLICGTLTPTIGSIDVHGRVAALLELGSGFNPEFTGRENVYLNAAVLGLSRDEIDQRFDAIAAFADIGEFIEAPVKKYSSGMYVRLAFAVAINVDPEILVVDEALSVGDELFQRKCFARIESIRAQGATILFVSHAAGTVVELCDRALLVDGGELLYDGAPKAVVSRYHKLLYAPAPEATVIREEIKGEREVGSAPTSKSNGNGDASHSSREPALSETFDPTMAPTSTVSFVSKGAVIDDFRIWNVDGKRVNGLIRGRRYCFGFHVAFSKDLYYVRFGSLIKGVTGLPICGTMSEARLLQGRAEAHKGQCASVEFWFDCLLNPGMYFVNAGVFGVEELGQAETLLHRIADALAFRVLPISENASTELIDFNCESRVQFDG